MKNKNIVVKGVRVNNLKNIDVTIPRGKLVVITGISGSGKSSLAFDTIYAEGQRRYVESLSSYTRQFLSPIKKPDIDYIEGLSPAISIDQKSVGQSPRSTVGTISDIYDYLRLLFAKIGKVYCPICGVGLSKISVKNNGKNSFKKIYRCEKCKIELPEFTMSSFSFNSPHGACTTCKGLGKKKQIDPLLVLPNKRLTLSEGAIRPWSRITSHRNAYHKILLDLSKKYNFSLDAPVSNLPKSIINLLLFGTKDNFFLGIIDNLEKKYQETSSDYIKNEIQKYMTEIICPDCLGKRLKKEVLSIRVAGKNIIDLNQMTIDDLLNYFSTIKNKISKEDCKISLQIIKDVIERLDFIQKVSLGYLSLNRQADTLAGGEAQRIKLATQLGSHLTGILYILDEPSIGLHSKDHEKLIQTLFQLRNSGNTVIVVEHDRETILAADHVIDIGPGAGELGGKIIAQGSPVEIKKSSKSLTGKYLTLKNNISKPKNRRVNKNKSLIIKGANEFNLKNIDVKIPLNTLTCVTGVSGSGKSTLMIDILAKALAQKFHRAKNGPGEHKSILGTQNIDKVINIDQSPIGRTPRSNPATYTQIFSTIREIFANTEKAQKHHLTTSHFSFNMVGGRCENCKGDGVIKYEMHFLPDVYITCDICDGNRYNKEILKIRYNEKNIAEVLEMTVDEAYAFFKDVPILKTKLGVLSAVGLGYIKLGQSATTLSGGEAQRIKLATELARQDTGKTLYILDEPTTGLHFEDIKNLLNVLQALVDKGNTVLVIEHNLDIIKCADHVIDMGPEGGKYGGRVIAQGTPEEITKVKKSYTGKYLKKIL